MYLIGANTNFHSDILLKQTSKYYFHIMKLTFIGFLVFFTNISFSQLAIPCNNWLSLPSYQSYISVGDLDVPGNKITVEAVFNRTTTYSNGYNWAGDLVSKHVDLSDVNYLLRPNNAEITTTNGYFTTPPICEIQLNKTYHVAMVYDGTTLKFYRNGFLMSSVVASGNLIQNNHQTRIGLYDALAWNTNLIGYINEVRIWNNVRTQSQIQTFMNTSLPSPTTQTGLLAYYQFDNLLNKQGNNAWNGSTGGTASINATNPNCNLIPDSCNITVTTGIGGIINDYSPVIDMLPCNKIQVEDAGKFNVGDTIVIMQMKGAEIDSANTSNFGSISNIKNAGNYEFNYVKAKTGSVITLLNLLTRSYDVVKGRVQLIRVPYYQSIDVRSELTCLPWDGRKGGVLILNVRDTINLYSNIDVSGKGFRGAMVTNPRNNSFYCHENNYFYTNDPVIASPKGEGITELSILRSSGKGPLANGGGGGLEHNSGGGGGSNSGVGGKGGKEWISCNPIDNGGLGGITLNYNNTVNKIFLGGGGGAGHCDNPAGFNPNGGNGAGILIIKAGFLKSNSRLIYANGDGAAECVRDQQAYKCHEGMGGGGAGGTILLNISTYLDNISVNAKGGKGADMNGEIQGKLGPGGGGGGGIIWFSNSSQPTAVTSNLNGGANGVNLDFANDPYNATPGQNGSTLFNLNIPIDNIVFRPPIDSVRIKDSLLACNNFNFKGLAYTNSGSISSWQWYFGDGNNAIGQNTSHIYSPGNYTVKLLVNDNNGCPDSISKNIIASLLTVTVGNNDTICMNTSTNLQATISGSNPILYSWSPAAYLNNPSILNPVASPPITTWFVLSATNVNGCKNKDSVLITVRGAGAFSISPPANICKGSNIQLDANGGDTYNWQPSSSLTNSSIKNPLASPISTTMYSVQITDTTCNISTTLSTMVTVLPLPIIKASKSNDIDCSLASSQLSASGGNQYTWSPASTLNNTNIINPIASPLTTTMYIVNGKDLNGCANADSVLVKVTATNKGGYLMPSGFTPNNDGLNDCYGIKYWGAIQELEFSIYNRWGERLFFTRNAGDCWNGKYKGVEQDPAVFIYMIKAKTSCDNYIFRKGSFSLIR
jgi:gliding motility-associated-like protein